MTASLLNQIGLALGLFSGLLLIPEILNLIPIEQLEKSIRKSLDDLENWSKFPLKLHPTYWKRTFTQEQRVFIELITAISSFIFSLTWIATLITGLLFSSKFFLVLSLITLMAGVLRSMGSYPAYVLRSSGRNILLIFLFALLIITILTPLGSLIRVVLLILRATVIRVKSRFAKSDALRNLLIALAIIAFIVSNVLQFAAAFYE
jgi:hypothetical protein